jgi:glycerophosphoryl diester phosphodiesterase
MRLALFTVLPVLLAAPAGAQLITAHRGASADAPENTLAAFTLAWEQQADAIEGDFRLSADGRIVCVHDADTKRIAGVNHVVAATPLAELRALDAGSWKDPRFADERLPTFAEVLAAVPDGKRFFIELKTGPEIVPALARELQGRRSDPALLTIIAFDADTIAACKRSLPAVRAHWLTAFKQDKASGDWRPDAETIAAAVEACGADGVGMAGRREVIDRDFVERLRSLGVREFHVWTVDAADDARFFRDLGAMGITTNRPAFIRAALAAPAR